VLSVIITAIFTQRVGWHAFMEKQIAQSKSAQAQMENMTPEQREQILDQRAKYAPYFGYIIGPIAIFVSAIVVAGLFLGAFNVMAGAELNFKTALAIVSFSWVPGLIGQLLGIVLLYIKSPETIDLQNLVASNVGALMSSDSPRWLVSLCTSIDVFSFWTIFLLATGFSVARPKKISMGRAYGVVVGLWLLYVVIKVGWAAIFS